MPMGFGAVAKKVVATKIVAADGSGDFTDIQEAIDALPAGGGVVYIKEGTYTITVAISITSDNISLIGAGKSTKIQTTGNIVMIDIVSADGILIEKLYLYGAGSGNTSNFGIHLNDSQRCSVSSCWVENMGMDGIRAENWSDDCIISNNYASSCVRLGIYAYETRRVIIIGNSSFSNSNGIAVEGTSEEAIVTGNLVRGNTQTGIAIVATGCIFSSNTCVNNLMEGIHANPVSNSIITDNYVVNNDYNNTASYDGIILEGSSDNNIIKDNRCKDNDRYEINIGAAACDKNKVEGNICIGTDHVGAINDDGTDTEISHNTTA